MPVNSQRTGHKAFGTTAWVLSKFFGPEPIQVANCGLMCGQYFLRSSNWTGSSANQGWKAVQNKNGNLEHSHKRGVVVEKSEIIMFKNALEQISCKEMKNLRNPVMYCPVKIVSESVGTGSRTAAG